MLETIRRVDYYYANVTDKPGEAARILGALNQAGVNLVAFSGFPSGARRAQLDFIPGDTAAFKAAAKKAGIKVSPRKTGFLIQGEDHPGAVAEIANKLAAAGINITAVDAICSGDGRYGALLWVKPPDVRRATKALGAV